MGGRKTMDYSEIKDTLLFITDPVEKLDFVMDLGKRLELPPKDAVCNEIHGCTSLVKICMLDNKFYGMADSVLVRGLVAIILSMIDGKTFNEIKDMDIEKEFLSLNLNLGINRLNGVNSMIRFLQNL